jgi:hypothetical protein
MVPHQRNTFFDPNKPGADWMADLARQAGLADAQGGGAKDKAERDARFVGDFTDDLTVAIALREYERAVQLVEDGMFSLLCCFLWVAMLTSCGLQARSKWARCPH